MLVKLASKHNMIWNIRNTAWRGLQLSEKHRDASENFILFGLTVLGNAHRHNESIIKTTNVLRPHMPWHFIYASIVLFRANWLSHLTIYAWCSLAIFSTMPRLFWLWWTVQTERREYSKEHTELSPHSLDTSHGIADNRIDIFIFFFNVKSK